MAEHSSRQPSSSDKPVGDLAAAMMGINAVKGVEIGDGFGAARLTGERNADPMRAGDAGPEFTANHAGGIAGGSRPANR